MIQVKITKHSVGWYLDGKLHKEDGPALEYVSGLALWFINGISLTKEEMDTRLRSSNNNVEN